ncbi:heparinase II/III domain-containing protein [Uliginosibacterium aquaticum]|uniref:Heparinase II/III family protein n=1 Tax=Uliginosibacterium aquaticum TaxID=2731212 RepID=A0ABX2ICG9_9RHOO|nr:heparinase II/III family protein [Uliginosibacterium aquaticum]NSL53972.1 heparinase II/III family protein [Uliginosibacterium aquaticum]
MQRREFLAALSLLGAQLAACRSNAPLMAAPASGHPRLLVSAEEWASLGARRKADPDLDRFADLLLARARKDLSLPVLERKLEGRRLLSVSREFIRRTLEWAFAYRITGESAFLERARREMLNIAAFSEWNPDHYLDVAEMTTGLAIGYDWLFDALQPAERSILRRAIVDKGIAQARQGHKTFRMTNNWNQVCIGGMVLGALAVQEDEPALAADLLAAAQKEIFTGLDAYKPDGAYPEGPGYWSYGTSYSVLLIAALRSASMADWGILAAPGFIRSAEFYAHSIGPSGKHFNFADGNEGQELPSPIVYLARELGQPALLEAKREMIRKNQGVSERFAPLSILWWPEARRGTPPPTSFIGQGPQPLALWRSAWGDTNALYFAIKGGGAAHNHAHMDAGSFVLELDGLRWAKDLGMQDYYSLESRGIDLWNMKQDSPRWQVFRLGAEAHNTLTVAGKPHKASAMASLTQVNAREVLIDLAPVLGLPQATRRVRFADASVELDDKIADAPAGTEIRWAMCTEAEIRIEGNTAILSQRGKTLHVRFSGQGIQLSVTDVSAARMDYDLPNPNTRQLLASAPVAANGSWHQTVRFSRA